MSLGIPLMSWGIASFEVTFQNGPMNGSQRFLHVLRSDAAIDHGGTQCCISLKQRQTGDYNRKGAALLEPCSGFGRVAVSPES
jgi:hypothetical protein